MTTIIIDCNEQKVYTDTLTTSTTCNKNGWLSCLFLEPPSISEHSHFSHTKKAYTSTNGVLVVGSGLKSAILGFRKYPENIPKAPQDNTSVYILSKKGETVQVISYEVVDKRFFRKPKWVEDVFTKTRGWIVTGSGSCYALGALYAGTTPQEAIIAASKADPCTGSMVDVYDIPEIGLKHDTI